MRESEREGAGPSPSPRAREMESEGENGRKVFRNGYGARENVSERVKGGTRDFATPPLQRRRSDDAHRTAVPSSPSRSLPLPFALEVSLSLSPGRTKRRDEERGVAHGSPRKIILPAGGRENEPQTERERMEEEAVKEQGGLVWGDALALSGERERERKREKVEEEEEEEVNVVVEVSVEEEVNEEAAAGDAGDDGDDDDDDDDDDDVDFLYSAENPIGVGAPTLDGRFWNDIGDSRKRRSRNVWTYGSDHMSVRPPPKRRELTDAQQAVVAKRALKYAAARRAATAEARLSREQAIAEYMSFAAGARELVPGLFLSSRHIFELSETPLAMVQSLGISHIVNVTTRSFEYERHTRDANINVTRIEVEDSSHAAGKLGDALAVAIAHIDRCLSANEPVLVHCFEGRSRSPTVCLAYLVKYRGFTLQDAYDHVLKLNGVLSINDGFLRRLMHFEVHHAKGALRHSTLKSYQRGGKGAAAKEARMR
jgi:protein-tyrosine phosphatase